MEPVPIGASPDATSPVGHCVPQALVPAPAFAMGDAQGDRQARRPADGASGGSR